MGCVRSGEVPGVPFVPQPGEVRGDHGETAPHPGQRQGVDASDLGPGWRAAVVNAVGSATDHDHRPRAARDERIGQVEPRRADPLFALPTGGAVCEGIGVRARPGVDTVYAGGVQEVGDGHHVQVFAVGAADHVPEYGLVPRWQAHGPDIDILLDVGAVHGERRKGGLGGGRIVVVIGA